MFGFVNYSHAKDNSFIKSYFYLVITLYYRLQYHNFIVLCCKLFLTVKHLINLLKIGT